MKTRMISLVTSVALIAGLAVVPAVLASSSADVAKALSGATALIARNARIGHLKKRLADMSMVDFSKIPHNKVGLGSTVVVLDVKRDEEVTYYIVTSEEADAPHGRVSTTSPIGRALLNKEVGDEVKVVSPGGIKDLEIRKLTTIHEVV